MNILELLPVGSVVRLNGATKNLMIFGVCQTEDKTQKTYDYIGVIWPEGNIGAEGQVLFNHSDVESVEFVGYDNRERREFLEKLNQFYAGK